MPDYTIGHYPHHARRAILDAVEDALAIFPKKDNGITGEVVVIVRVAPPEAIHLTAGDLAPDRARGCATKVIP